MAAKRRKAGNNRQRARKGRRDPLARERALEALQRMRTDGESLTRAAREVHTTPETVRRYVGSALIRTRRGRWAATPSDRLTRRVWFLTPQGKVEVAVRSSRTASRIARYMAAVDRYLRLGETDALQEFVGKFVRSRGASFVFLTDPRVLDRLAHAGEVSFERLYVQRA